MASLITSVDKTYSIRGTEWHGLANVPRDDNGNPVRSLTIDHLGDICFPIISLQNLQGTANGDTVMLPDFQAVAADLRGRGQGIVPLGMHTDSYKVIENSAIWSAIQTALKDHDHVITTAGTLDGCKRFYITAQLTADGSGFSVNGERFDGFLNFVTSHDGSLACQAYDSSVRIVCNNTLNFSMERRNAKHAVYVKHTSNADVELVNAAAWIDDCLAGRVKFSKDYDRAMNTAASEETAMQALTGFFWRKTGKNDRLSTRTRNQIDEIFQAFQTGKGNRGETMADLLNGITEHYTSGSGTGLTRKGQEVTALDKHVSSQFGAAAEIKQEFARIILAADGTEMQDLIEMGRDKGMPAYRDGKDKPVYVSGINRTRRTGTGYVARPDSQFAAPVTVPAQSGGNDFASLLDMPFSPKMALLA